MDLADLSIAAAAKQIASRAVSPQELVDACLKRAERLEPVVRSLASFEPERALESARLLGEELVTSEPRSPLHGIPLAIKDVIDVRGFSTKGGSKFLPDEPRLRDAPVVARLRAAGAVILAKSHAHEFAYGAVTPPTKNPWDLERIPGGSSGGSAAAVAGGECLGALGTDTAGSIRIPAAFCGVSGFVPRRESVPREGIIPLSWTFDRCGPIARTAEDLGILFASLAQRPGLVSQPRPDFSGITFGVPHLSAAMTGVDQEIEEATDDVLKLISDQGGRRIEVDLPPFSDWDRATGLRLMVEALVAHQEEGWYPNHADDYGDKILASLQFAERVTASQLIEADRHLATLREWVYTSMVDVDILVLPTTPVVAPMISAIDAEDKVATDILRSLTRMGGFVNATDLAAVTIPSGLNRARLPMGVQFIGPNENVVLAAAEVFQGLTDFHIERPTLLYER